jgi:hypothetical protein
MQPMATSSRADLSKAEVAGAVDPFRPVPIPPEIPDASLGPVHRLRRIAGQAVENRLPNEPGWKRLGSLVAIALLAAASFPGPPDLPMRVVLGCSVLILSLLLTQLNRHRLVRNHQLTRDIWERDYRADYQTLQQTGLALCIAEDEMWQQLLSTHGLFSAKYYIAYPASAGQRLIYATAFWQLLLDYNNGVRRDVSAELLARKNILTTLLSKPRELSSGYNIGWLARFAALYDFFYVD